MTLTSLILILHIVFLSVNFSEVPYEKFYIDRNNIPIDFLKVTTGVITLSSGVHKINPVIDIYADDFQKYESVNLLDKSHPISNFGYHPEKYPGISNYRYLIIDENENYLKIVYDFLLSKSGWVSKEQIEERFYSSIKTFDDLETNFGEFLSLFDLQKNDTRKVFSLPDSVSNYREISNLEVDKKEIKILNQTGDFLKIAIVDENCSNEIKIIEELGWILMRDDQGALNIWVIAKDLC